MRYFIQTAAFVLATSIVAGVARAQEPVPPSPPPAVSPSPEEAPDNMILIPSGEFQMGTNATDNTDDNQGTNTPLGNNDARPQHAVTTKAFYIDKTEVTNAQYKKFCDATGYAPPPHWKNGQFPEGQGDFPVTRVNWYEATAFARWAGKRLPSEAEWEHAARGTDGRSYPWGNDWSEEKIVHGDNPAIVGSKAAGASPYGVLDMAGNVAEWTSSWFDAYPNSPTNQPDFGKKTLKVVRGGPWYGGNSLELTYYRMVGRPDSRNMWIGFRCAKDTSTAQ